MIDIKARGALADGIESYLNGEINSFQLDDILVQVNAEDLACREIAREFSRFIDDFTAHMYAGGKRLKPEYEAGVRRWIEFLRAQTDWPADVARRSSSFIAIMRLLLSALQAERTAFRQNPYWPFETEADWAQWRRDVAAMDRCRC